MSDTAQTVSVTVDVASDALFAALAHPAAHVAADGSGMLRGLASSTPETLTGEGQIFTVLMSAEDGRGYSVDNHVTAFEPGRRIAWMPAKTGGEPIGVEWSWELQPEGAGTRVHVTCDWGRVTSEAYLARFTLPRVSADKVHLTIERMTRWAAR